MRKRGIGGFNLATIEDCFTHTVLFELDRIRFTEAPIAVPEVTRRFVRALANTASTDGRSLFQFVLRQRLDTLRDGAIRLLLDSDISSLFVECNSLGMNKENAIADQNFELAARLRDRQYAVRAKLRQKVPEPIALLPVHVVQVFRNLGFDGPIQERV